MLKKVVPCLAITLMLSTTQIYAADTNQAKIGKDLAYKVDRRDQGYRDTSAQLTMTIANKAGNSTVRKLRIDILEMENEGDRSLMVFDFPADIRGTSLLSHPKFEGNDEQWLYLPSIKRTKRISSRNKSGAFVGSEFSFEDLSDKNVEEFTYKHLGTVSCQISTIESNTFPSIDQTCEKLQRVPLDKHSGYSRQVLTIDSGSYRILTIDYYDVRGNLLKTLVSENFQLFDEKYWRPLRVVMTNVQTGKSTTLEYETLDFSIGLNEQHFKRSSLRH